MVKEATSTPPITIGDIGEGAVVTFAPPPTSQHVEVNAKAAGSTEHEDSWFTAKTVRLPTSVALCIFAVGLIATVFAIRYAIKAAKSSASGAAILSLGDETLARSVQAVRNLAGVVTDPMVIAQLKSIEAEGEANRAKFKAKVMDNHYPKHG